MKASDGKKTPPTQRGLGSIYRRTVTEADGMEREIPIWHIQFSVNGRQYRESTHTVTLRNFLPHRKSLFSN